MSPELQVKTNYSQDSDLRRLFNRLRVFPLRKYKTAQRFSARLWQKNFYVFLKKVLNEWKYMYKMYHVEEQYLTAWYYIPLTGFNRFTFFFITGSSSEAHHDSFCFVQTWSKDICGCKCESSAVNDCIQMELGIDVDCQCVDVKAFRRHKAGKHVSLKWVYL